MLSYVNDINNFLVYPYHFIDIVVKDTMAFDTTYEKDDVKEINEVVRSTVNVLDDFDYNLYAIITAVIEVYMGCMELLDPPDNNVNAHVFLVLGMDEANSL